MAILALDLASKTGWAVYAKGMDRPHFGTEIIKRKTGSLGEAACRFEDFLFEKREIYEEFTDIVFEAQHVAEKINPMTVTLLMGLAFDTEKFAHKIGARVFCVPIGTWRSSFLGKGAFKHVRNEKGKVVHSARDQAKERAIDVCNELGWYPPDDNAADACGILDYYIKLLPSTRGIIPPWRDATFLAGVRRG